MDMSQAHIQRDLFENRKITTFQKRVVYGERDDKGTTILRFPDLEEHLVRRVEIRDPNIVFEMPASANESFTVLASVDRSQRPFPATMDFYAFSADAARLWHKVISDYGSNAPIVALIGKAFYMYLPGVLRMNLFDARTGDPLWRREN